MSELYHYGVKGMKWGVRKKGNSDSNKLANLLSKQTEAYAKYDTNTKRYYNPSTGNTIEIGNPKHRNDIAITKEKYLNFKKTLQKRYDSVESKSNIDYENGKAYVTAVLKKKGNTYVSELEASFDSVSNEYMESLYDIFKY